MQNLIIEISKLLAHIFCVDQTSYIVQQPGGEYKRTYGVLDFSKIRQSINSNGSIGSYQKNRNSTVKWICFDFDVAKKHIGENTFEDAIEKLNAQVDLFCRSLRGMNLPYLLEFSGNRGMHVWLIFSQPIAYAYAHEFSQEILRQTGKLHEADDGYVNIDLFPASRTPSKGVGLGVKLPLSKHVKSGVYALLLQENSEPKNSIKIKTLNTSVLEEQIDILKHHKLIHFSDIERTTPVLMNWDAIDKLPSLRIESIILTKRVTVEALLCHWSEGGKLAKLSDQITDQKSLSHGARRLLVGIFSNVSFQADKNYGKNLLKSVFSQLDNYDEKTTDQAINNLAGFNFPTQSQIESVCGKLDIDNCEIEILISICIPYVKSFCDRVLQITADDVDVVRAAELRYVYQNDEVQCESIVNNLKRWDKYDLLNQVNDLIAGKVKPDFYEHFRQEDNKIRRLISQDAPTRLTTSSILHQLSCTLDFQPSSNSKGYQIAAAFKGGYIFKPWLNLWIDFIGSIQGALEDPENKDCFIVKTDISSFYDTVPQENLKRLMMGGVNSKIDFSLNCLSVNQKESYRILLETLFQINSSMTSGNRGLPQGPAYARFLSEIYLDNIDAMFDEKLAIGEIILYQRYVDDIFFICKNEDLARGFYAVLVDQVNALGLNLNFEKTIIGPVRDFDKDFKRFSAQSKYAVDKASKGYEKATPTQKNLAVSELLNIIQSDSFDEDLAFIFSHLNGIPEVDALKEAKVIETLKRAKGRGSMLRHLFTFVFAKPERWQMLLEIDKYDGLQSEVLSTCILQAIKDYGRHNKILLTLIVEVVSRLELTRLTEENVAALWLAGVPLKEGEPHPHAAMVCLAANIDPNVVNLSDEAVSKLTLTLNSIASMREFTACIFPLCISAHISKVSLNILAQTFYSKLLNDYRLGELSSEKFSEMKFKRSANEFYQLLCLFSLSKENKNADLLKAAWRLATDLSNSIQESDFDISADAWFDRLDEVDISASNNHLIISSIIDGSIYRGGQPDVRKIYEAFHHKIVIHIARQDLGSGFETVKAALELLKAKANFYRWILEGEEVSRFPSNIWFERNICENDLILLARGSEVLVRRPTDKFKIRENIVGEHYGYGERIESLHLPDHISVRDALDEMGIVNKIDKLIEWLEKYKGDGEFPNIFSQNRLIHATTHEPFSVELSNHSQILFEDAQFKVSIHPNNISSFVECFFRLVSENLVDGALNLFWTKYLSKLPDSFNLSEFIIIANNELKQMANAISNVSLDFAMAAALYSTIFSTQTERRISVFVEVYEKFNPKPEDQHIYCINADSVVGDQTPNELFDSLEASFDLVSSKVLSTTLFNLGSDLKLYRSAFEAALLIDEDDVPPLRLENFKKTRVNILLLTKAFEVFGDEYDFEKSFIVNSVSRRIEPYETVHLFNIKNSEHVFSHVANGRLYLLPLTSAMSKAFLSLKKRGQALAQGNLLMHHPIGLARVLNLSLLSCYDQAVRNVAAQRSIDLAEAKSFLESWLSGLPERYRGNLCRLIAAHHVMTKGQIDEFAKNIGKCVTQEKSNIFFIKNLDDFNGTQRIIARNSELIRQVADYGPHRIVPSMEDATLVVDLVLSGSQIIRALKYYALNEGRYEQYYRYSDRNEQERVANVLKGLKKLKILQVFHTTAGIESIQRECRNFLDPDICVEVIGGANVDHYAYFGTSNALGMLEKESLRKLLSDKEMMRDIYAHLRIPKESKRSLTDFKDSKIDGIDLIGRYRSLPKKCFYFLHASILHNENISPFERTRELYEIPHDDVRE